MDDKRNRLHEARALETAGRYNEAVEILLKIGEDDPDYESALMGLGVLYMQMNLYEEAAMLWDIAAKKFPENLFGVSNGIFSRLELKDYEKALKLCDDVLARHPGDLMPKNFKTEALRGLGRNDEAAELSKEIIASGKAGFIEVCSAALEMSGNGKYDEALNLLDDTRKKRGDNAYVIYHKARVLLEAGRYAECIEECDYIRKLKNRRDKDHLCLVDGLKDVPIEAVNKLLDEAVMKRHKKMNFSGFLSTETVLLDLEADSIEEIAGILARAALRAAGADGKMIEPWSRVVAESVVARQKIGSTAMGNGAAALYPNMYDDIKEVVAAKTVAALAVLKNPSDWRLKESGLNLPTLDGKPVKTVWFILCATADGDASYFTGKAITASRMSHLFRNREALESVEKAGTAEDAIRLIAEAEDKMFARNR